VLGIVYYITLQFTLKLYDRVPTAQYSISVYFHVTYKYLYSTVDWTALTQHMYEYNDMYVVHRPAQDIWIR
jgi:hypothetical protein